jgi:hypothetical protein
MLADRAKAQAIAAAQMVFVRVADRIDASARAIMTALAQMW